MNPCLLKYSARMAGLVLVATLAGAASPSDDTKGPMQSALDTDEAAAGTLVVMRADKEDLLIGAHVDGRFVRDSASDVTPSSRQPEQATDTEDKFVRRGGWFDEALRFLERSTERTWRRTVYLADQIGKG
jgi:hypothetical protein